MWKQNLNNMKKKTKHTLLKGEGIHQHTLYGNFKVGNEPEFTSVDILEETELKHEKPNGTFGEHNTLIIEKGDWVQGKQVEYNPFNRQISRVWD